MKFLKNPSISIGQELMLVDILTKPNRVSKTEEGLIAHMAEKPQKKRKRCIYMREEECAIPNTPFTLCKTCPFGYIYCFGAVVNNLYKKIVGIAMFFMNQDNQRR